MGFVKVLARRLRTTNHGHNIAFPHVANGAVTDAIRGNGIVSTNG